MDALTVTTLFVLALYIGIWIVLLMPATRRRGNLWPDRHVERMPDEQMDAERARLRGLVEIRRSREWRP